MAREPLQTPAGWSRPRFQVSGTRKAICKRGETRRPASSRERRRTARAIPRARIAPQGLKPPFRRGRRIAGFETPGPRVPAWRNSEAGDPGRQNGEVRGLPPLPQVATAVTCGDDEAPRRLRVVQGGPPVGKAPTAGNWPASLPRTPAFSAQTFSWPCKLLQKRYNPLERNRKGRVWLE